MESKLVISESALVDNMDHRFQGEDNEIVISNDTKVKDTHIYIGGKGNKLILEKGCNIIGECWFYLESENCEVRIGEYTTIGSVEFAVFERNNKIIIGRDCLFARGITIRTSDSHSIIDLANNKRINQAQDVKIGNHVWVCTNVHILKGVTIGTNSVIALGSTVTHDLPDNCVAGGSPAEVIRNNTIWYRELIELPEKSADASSYLD
jgi:acetyltransferase-like isoleucine patch superfamily enzyme